MKKAADRTKKINYNQRSITKTTSESTVNSRLRMMQSLQNELVRISDDKAALSNKLAQKRKRRSEIYIKLQKEEQNEQKDLMKKQFQINMNYEKQISDLENNLLEKLSLTKTNNANKFGGTKELVEEEFDVFISHAWEDKESFVDEFVDCLNKLGIKAWYDKEQIKWGTSLREKIDKGLSKSKFGIVIISHNYIADGKYWTKAELEGIFQLHSIQENIMLPIWHNITKKEVMSYSPIIAGKLAMTTSNMTPEEIAYELYKLINDTKMEENNE